VAETDAAASRVEVQTDPGGDKDVSKNAELHVMLGGIAFTNKWCATDAHLSGASNPPSEGSSCVAVVVRVRLLRGGFALTNSAISSNFAATFCSEATASRAGSVNGG
jgi:hypothetical protein